METLSTEPTRNRSFPVKLFRGDVRLSVTYWVFGVLIGGFFFAIVIEIAEHNYIDIVRSKVGAIALQVGYWLMVVYSIFVAVAIWRSAGKYTGNQAWAILARVAVVLGGVSLLASLVTVLDQGSDSTFALEEELLMIRKGLPTMIDESTRLDDVSLQEEDIHYDYTLIGYAAGNIDVERFKVLMSARIKTTACTNPETRSFLDAGRSLVYLYRDKHSKPLAEIMVTKSDCLGAN